MGSWLEIPRNPSPVVSEHRQPPPVLTLDWGDSFRKDALRIVQSSLRSCGRRCCRGKDVRICTG
jgi:hypothetical protein